jgi:DNA-binding transcriptional MerR regulator
MPKPEHHLYGIRAVSDLTGIPPHVLRQWEARYPQLKPKRDTRNNRTYTPADIEIIRRIKELTRHERLTTPGAKRRLSQELHGEGRPKTNAEILDLLDKIQDEVRAMLDILDPGPRG